MILRSLLAALILSTASNSAYAYIDAGIGALVLQSLIAGFFSFMVMWRHWSEKIKAFFRKLFKRDAKAEEEV